MTLVSPRPIVLSGLAIGVSALLAGCDAGGTVTAPPRTAADAGRQVIRPAPDAAPVAPPETAASESPTSDPVTATLPAEPVAAPKPPSEKPKVVLAAAERAQGNLSIADPAGDPSRYPGGIVPASPTAEPLPGGPRLLVPERNFRTDGRSPALQVNYDDLDLLKVLNMGDPLPADAVEMFPSWLKELDGKTIRIRGFMYPAYEEMLSAFILTRDTGVCCFGPNPKVYYLIGVKLKEGTKARYIENRPFDVVGTFHINPVVQDGRWFQLYKITDATVVD